MSKPIRIVVIDSHPIFRQGVIRTIGRSDGMALVGEGTTAADAQRLAGDKQPDILILDIAIRDGLDVVAEMATLGVKCLILTALDDVLSVSNALAAGANGYILKGVSGLELIGALKAVHGGQPYVTAELAVRLLIGVKGKSLVPKRDAKVQAALTYREQQVLEHITKGYTNQEIAERLGLTIGTIKYYLSQLFKNCTCATAYRRCWPRKIKAPEATTLPMWGRSTTTGAVLSWDRFASPARCAPCDPGKDRRSEGTTGASHHGRHPKRRSSQILMPSFPFQTKIEAEAHTLRIGQIRLNAVVEPAWKDQHAARRRAVRICRTVQGHARSRGRPPSARHAEDPERKCPRSFPPR